MNLSLSLFAIAIEMDLSPQSQTPAEHFFVSQDGSAE